MSALDPHCPATAHVIDQTLMSIFKEVEIYLDLSDIFDIRILLTGDFRTCRSL